MITRQIEGGRMDGMRLKHIRTLLAGLALIVGVARVDAYPMYDDGAGNGCVSCHPQYFDDPNSPTPFGSLHVAHLTKFGISKCGLCHMNPAGGDTPVYTFTSAEGFGCAGCHGQNYGETIPTGLGLPNEGAPKASAYGLRKALDDLFAVLYPSDPAPCATCHFPGSPVTGDPSPAPALFPETVVPPYYQPTFSNLTDPCSSAQENWDGSTTTHLDNDGNGAANYEADSACQAFIPPTTTTVVTTSTTTTTLVGTSAPRRITVYPGQSIQEAVNAVRPGGTVYIMPGTYEEPHSNTNAVEVNKDGIRLIARSKPKQGLKVILKKRGAQTNGLVVQPAVPGGRINGFQVKGLTVEGFPNNGILTRYLDNFKIERNETANNLENGIWPTLSANGLVKRNVSYGSDDAALWVEASENIRVIKNEVYDSPTGLEVTVSSNVVMKANNVHDNVVGIGLYHALGAGIPPLQPLERNGDWEVSRNDVYNNNKVNDVTGGLVGDLPSGIGILIVGVDRVKVDRNTITNNKTMGLAMADWCLVASCPNPYPPTIPEAVPENNVVTKNVFTNNAYDPEGEFAFLAADITYAVPAPVPGTTSPNNCFAGNVLSSIVGIPPITQTNRCD